MLLADTSVWIDHFKHISPQLQDALQKGQIVIHPWIIGEIACGFLHQRAAIFQDLAHLPVVIIAQDHEVRHLIEHHRLMGRGIGWVDMHLLTSCLLSRVKLWTRDRNLAKVAMQLDIAHTP